MSRYFLAIVSIVLSVAIASAQEDWGEPDSAYLMTPAVAPLLCTEDVAVTAPVHIVTDDWYWVVEFWFSWQGAATCDTVTFEPPWGLEGTVSFVDIDNESRTGYAGA